MTTTITHLECSHCGQSYAAGQAHNLCERCQNPLLVRYDLARARSEWSREDLEQAPKSMWRYGPVLPAQNSDAVVTLGEGFTPLLRTSTLGGELSATNLWVKDEGLNPTGSFKARGLSCALTMCRQFGIEAIAIPSAGNAGGAAATYAAAAGIQAHVFMPKDVPHSNFVECSATGAKVTLVDGLISDCGRIVAERKTAEGWFEVSTLKEPYRIEGKKTMGYEVAEQLGWELPDAILYPAGGGVGLIGMWKAFDELEEMGWIGSNRPKLIAVQAEGCKPVVDAWQAGADRAQFYNNASTVASGLRVPKPLGDALMMRAMRETKGTAIAISDDEMVDAALLCARTEGVFAAPEGGACVAAVRKLISTGFLDRDEQIVIFNTGTGLKYMEAFSTRFPRQETSDTDKLGGLITPR